MSGSNDQTLPVEAISAAPKEKPPSEQQKSGVDPLTGQANTFAQELGKVGGFIGGKTEKAGNIAYIVVVLAFIIMVMAGIAAAIAEKDKLIAVFDRLVTGCLSLLTGALGYLFGSGGNNSRPSGDQSSK